MTDRGERPLIRVIAFVAVAALAVVVVFAGRALLGEDPVESPSSSLEASTSAAASASAAPPSGSPSLPGDVPAELLDKAWLGFDGANWQIGTIGVGPKSTLPAGEYGLSVGGDFVLSIDAATSSEVFIREIDTARLVHQMATDLHIDDGAIWGERIFLAGVIKDGDAGIWAGRTGESGLIQLIPGSDGPMLGDRGTFRTGIKLSRTGQTLASTVCVAPACVTQIVSTEGGPVLTIADSIARWVSEDFVVTNDRPHIRGYGLDDGKQRWQLDDLDFWDGYFTSDGKTFIAQALTEDGSKEIWQVDADTGGHDVLAILAGDQYLFSSLSSDRYAVVLTSSSLADALGSGAAFEVVDLTNGELVVSHPFPRSPS